MAVAAGAAAAVAADGVAQPARWTVAPSPSVRLGHDPDDTLATFALIESATRLSDGSIIVGDRADYALKRFAPDGRLLQRFGRKGTGPGEIDYLARMSRCGDSLYTYDVEGYRQQVFTLDGRYVRLYRWSGPGNSPYRSACNAAGRFVHYGWETRSSEMKGGPFRVRVPLWMSPADSTHGPVLDSIPGADRWGLVVDGTFRGTRPLPLGKEPVIGIGRNRLYVGTADSFAIAVLDFQGRRVGTLRRDAAPLPTTREDIRDYIELEIAADGEQYRERYERRYAEMEFPPTLPAYTALVVDAEDLVWVRAFPRGTGPTARWSVFAPTGALVAEVEVPRYLEVFEIGRDYLLGRYFDPVEAMPEVRLYRLTR